MECVAKGVGVTKGHIQHLESGRSKTTTFELVVAMARHFEVPLEVFVDGYCQDRGN